MYMLFIDTDGVGSARSSGNSNTTRNIALGVSFALLAILASSAFAMWMQHRKRRRCDRSGGEPSGLTQANEDSKISKESQDSSN